MSYCRWSSDDFGCDLYCYETNKSFVAEVASHKVVSDLVKLGDWPSGDDAAQSEYMRRHDLQLAQMQTAIRAPIGLPHDGASIWVDTLGEFRATLLMLRAEGYRFPGYVLEEVEREIAQHGAGSGPVF